MMVVGNENEKECGREEEEEYNEEDEKDEGRKRKGGRMFTSLYIPSL